MSNFLSQINGNPLTRKLARFIGLPNPVELDRENGGYVTKPFVGKVGLVLSSNNGYAFNSLKNSLTESGVTLLDAKDDIGKIDFIVLDMTGCADCEDYTTLYQSFNPLIKRLSKNGRVLITASSLDKELSCIEFTLSRGVEGFSRSLAKELGYKGVTVNLIYVCRDAVDRLNGVVRFFCGKQSAYITGQTVDVKSIVKKPDVVPLIDVLANKIAIVTGGARGIGLETVKRLLQEGATVICIDIPEAKDELEKLEKTIGIQALPLDISLNDSPEKIVNFIKARTGRVDIVVHNAGVTRDKTLAKMSKEDWSKVIDINLLSIINIDKELIKQNVIRENGKIVCLSSTSGIAGNFGQTNYAATKAALIGYVKAQAEILSKKSITINAVAPGFIETRMTEKMPIVPREIGRCLNSLKQGGTPRDVAELITFLSSPSAHGITGNIVRVCGQSLLGA